MKQESITQSHDPTHCGLNVCAPQFALELGKNVLAPPPVLPSQVITSRKKLLPNDPMSVEVSDRHRHTA
jgi:hypothetical protein